MTVSRKADNAKSDSDVIGTIDPTSTTRPRRRPPRTAARAGNGCIAARVRDLMPNEVPPRERVPNELIAVSVVNLFGSEWLIGFVRGLIKHDDGDAYGLTDYTERQIWLSDCQPVRGRRNTLFHEIFHAAVYHCPHIIGDEELLADFFGFLMDSLDPATIARLESLIVADREELWEAYDNNNFRPSTTIDSGEVVR